MSVRRKPISRTAGVASLIAMSLLLSLSGCMVGPRYDRPAVETPSDWHWKKASLVEQAKNGLWWQVFKDPKLDELESLAMEANQDLKAAVARVDESRALARLSKSEFYPQITSSPGFSRSEDSAHDFLPGATGTPRGIRTPHNFFSLPVSLSYEIDAWGRIRKSVAAATDRAEARVADYHTIILTVTSDVAINYYLLHSLDAEADVLEHTLALRKKSLELVTSQFKFGAIDALDVARAKTDVSTTLSDMSDVGRRRAETTHIIAILCGKPATDFVIENKPLTLPPPEIPADLPSMLLERRPDVVHAERLLAASNEEIGVARAAFFPRFSLTGSAGLESQELTNLFNWQSTVWNFATGLAQPVFTGGRNKANLEASRARYDQATAQYKQQVLVAFKDVEDALAGIQFRAEQAKFQAEAVDAAREVTTLATKRYENGQVTYLDVVDAQRKQLEVELGASRILGQRLVSTIQLIKSLGGGW